MPNLIKTAYPFVPVLLTAGAAMTSIGISKRTPKSQQNTDSDNKQNSSQLLNQMCNSPATLSARAMVNNPRILCNKDDGINIPGFYKTPDYRSTDKLNYKVIGNIRDLNDYDIDVDDDSISFSDFELIKNIHLKEIFNKLKNENMYHMSQYIGLCYSLLDIDRELENVDDIKISDYVNSKLEYIKTLNLEDPCLNDVSDEENLYKAADTLSEISNIVKAYNTLTEKTVMLRDSGNIYNIFFDRADSSVYFLNLRDRYPKEAENMLNDLNQKAIDGDYKADRLTKEFNMAQKLEPLMHCESEHPIIDYIYKEYYLDKLDIPQPIKDRCLKIFDTYGTKIILTEYSNNIEKTLNIIENEFHEWSIVNGDTKSSSKEVKFPKWLNLNIANSNFLSSTKAYTDTFNIYFRGGNTRNFARYLRHEMTHLNDTRKVSFYRITRDPELKKLADYVMPGKEYKDKYGNKDIVVDFDNCKFREEFLKAGINPNHIKYAYTNVHEFIAVAAEGNCEVYSDELKAILIKFGMPEEVFNMTCFDDEVVNNSMAIQSWIEEHPEQTYEDIVENYDTIAMDGFFMSLFGNAFLK